jgi:ATP-binding cassette subfamily C (CFTR/MRP) protein 1
VHTCRSSDLVLIGWSALSVLAIPYLRTTIRDGALTTPAGNAIWSAFASAVIFGAVGLGIELLGPRWTWRDEGKIKLEDGARPERGGSDNPFLTANFFERLTFSWLTPLMKLGSKRYIDEDDVFSRESRLRSLCLVPEA